MTEQPAARTTSGETSGERDERIGIRLHPYCPECGTKSLDIDMSHPWYAELGTWKCRSCGWQGTIHTTNLWIADDTRPDRA